MPNSSEPVFSVKIVGISRDVLIELGSACTAAHCRNCRIRGSRLNENLAQRDCMLMRLRAWG